MSDHAVSERQIDGYPWEHDGAEDILCVLEAVWPAMINGLAASVTPPTASLRCFFSYLTPQAATWIAHGLFLPKKDWFTGAGAAGRARRAAAGVPDDVAFQTKPQIARRKFQTLREVGVRFTWAVGDEIYGRYAALRDDHEKNGEAYAYFVPKNFLIPTCTGGWHSAQQLAQRAQKYFEVRSAGPGRYGPRWYEWAMTDAGAPRHHLLKSNSQDLWMKIFYAASG